MATLHDDLDDAPPLDPAMERVQARLRRLILIAGLTLGVGVLAVFGAIVYRIATVDTSSPPVIARPEALAATLTHADLGLPAGAELTATDLDGSRLTLTYAYPGGHTVVVLDASSLTVRGTLDLPDPAP